MQKNKLIFGSILLLIIVPAVILRLLIFDKVGGDYNTYKDAMNALVSGQNPYVATVESFKSNMGEHGYAYFPTLMYIQTAIWLLNNWSGIIISTVILWKVPVLICDFLLLYLLLKKIKQITNWQSIVLTGAISFFWLLNPYLLSRYDYSLYDPIFLLFLFLALENIEKRPGFSGVFYALSVSLKTIPIILLPLVIIKTGPKLFSLARLKFFGACVAVFIVISIPFMRGWYDFNTYMQGAFFVQSQREVQGRPFLSIASLYTRSIGLDFNQQNNVTFYSVFSLLLAMLLPVYLWYRYKLLNVYLWATVSFSAYLLTTPVLSRTHILWLMPWLLVTLGTYAKSKKFQAYSVLFLVFLWAGLFFYLLAWNKGIEVESVDGRKITYTKPVAQEWEFTRLLRQKYYEFR